MALALRTRNSFGVRKITLKQVLRRPIATLKSKRRENAMYAELKRLIQQKMSVETAKKKLALADADIKRFTLQKKEASKDGSSKVAEAFRVLARDTQRKRRILQNYIRISERKF